MSTSSVPEPDVATLTVARQAPDDVGIRQIVITLDGAEFCVLLNGDSVTKAVSAGAHRLRFNNTLVWKTVALELKPGEHARFLVTNCAGWGTYAMVATLGVGPIYLKVERQVTGAREHESTRAPEHKD